SLHLAPRGTTEEVRQLHGMLAVGMALRYQGTGVAEGGSHREELHDDVHAPEQEPLLPLQPRLIDHDPVEALASELAATALDEAHVRRQAAEVAIAERCRQPFEPERWIPGRVEARDPGQGRKALADSLPGIGHGADDLQMLVHRLAGHEQMHDLAGALEDQVDPAVAQQPLDADRLLPSAPERTLGLVAATSADLQRAVDELPGADRVPLLGRRRLEPDVVATPICHLAGQPPDRVH